jgi:hypothetical protein
MTIFRVLALAGGIAAAACTSGCGGTQKCGATVEVDAMAAQPQSQTLSIAGGQGALITLGAGDVLGQHIHVFDVYIAALEMMGPEAPDSPFDDLVATAPVGRPISAEIALSMVPVD